VRAPRESGKPQRTSRRVKRAAEPWTKPPESLGTAAPSFLGTWSKPISALKRSHRSAPVIEAAAARAPISSETTYCARSAHTALSSNETFAEASFTTPLCPL